jgi:GDP-L-fucose synthase
MPTKKRVLLLGSGGFIGHNLKDQLSSDYDLISPRSQELDLVDDTAVKNYLRKLQPELVINAAVFHGSRKYPNMDNFLSINLRIFYNLMHQRGYYGRLIHFGSGAEYDKSRPLIKVTEDDFDRTIPKDNYGFYKYICSKYIIKSDNIICLRPFGVYGKYEDYSIRFISYAICCLLFRIPIKINQNVIFDYLYINDLVRIVDWFINHRPKCKFYNIGRGRTIDLLTIANRLTNLFNPKINIVVNKSGLANQYSCSIKRLKQELPNFQFTDFNQSLVELFNWYKINKKIIKKSSLFFD